MLGAVLPALWAIEAQAKTFTVTSNADDGVGCTFRAAVAAANGAINACTGTPSADNIVQLGGPNATAIVVNARPNGTIQVTSSMTIDGNYQGQHNNFNDVVLSMSGSTRMLQVLNGANLNLSNVRITGINAPGVSGAALQVLTNSTATLDNVQIDNCIGAKGVFYSLGYHTIYWSSFHDNQGTLGGAIYDGGPGSTISNSTFTNNRANQSSSGSGGAIYIDAIPGGSLNHKVITSTFSGNSAIYGGAVWLVAPFFADSDTFDGNSASSTGGAIQAMGTFMMTNSTLVRNSASAGGAIYRDTRNFPNVYWAFRHNTVFSNTASGAGGGLDIIDPVNNVTYDLGFEDIIWGNHVNAPSGGADVAANFNSSNLDCFNLIGVIADNSGHAPTSCLKQDPQLGAYVSVNQRPKVYALNPTSPAINAGGNAAITDGMPDYISDARGSYRPISGNWDMGAYEYDPNQVNLATTGTAVLSSALFGTTAGLAIDGSTDGAFGDGSVFHTGAGMNDYAAAGQPDAVAFWPGQFWYVDFGPAQVVGRVNIFNRSDCCLQRLSHYNILAFDDSTQQWFVVSDHSGDDTSHSVFLSWSFNPVVTRAIMIAKTNPSDPDSYLHLAEVQILSR